MSVAYQAWLSCMRFLDLFQEHSEFDKKKISIPTMVLSTSNACIVKHNKSANIKKVCDFTNFNGEKNSTK